MLVTNFIDPDFLDIYVTTIYLTKTRLKAMSSTWTSIIWTGTSDRLDLATASAQEEKNEFKALTPIKLKRQRPSS